MRDIRIILEMKRCQYRLPWKGTIVTRIRELYDAERATEATLLHLLETTGHGRHKQVHMVSWPIHGYMHPCMGHVSKVHGYTCLNSAMWETVLFGRQHSAEEEVSSII